MHCGCASLPGKLPDLVKQARVGQLLAIFPLAVASDGAWLGCLSALLSLTKRDGPGVCLPMDNAWQRRAEGSFTVSDTMRTLEQWFGCKCAGAALHIKVS